MSIANYLGSALLMILLSAFTASTASGQDCNNDIIPPSIVCNSPLSITLVAGGSPVSVLATDLVNEVIDDCDPSPAITVNLLSESTGLPSDSTSITITTPGTYEVELWVTDESGHTAFCITHIIATNQGSGADCTGDTTPPLIACNNSLSVELPADGSPAIVLASDVVALASDLCDPNLDLNINLLSEGIGEPSGNTQLVLTDVGEYLVQLWATDDAGNFLSCFAVLYITESYYPVSGRVFADENANCIQDNGEEVLSGAGQIIRAVREQTAEVVETTVEADGSFLLALPWPEDSLNNIRIEWLLPEGIGTSCSNSTLYDMLPADGMNLAVPMPLVSDCNYLTIDVSSPYLRRCFNNICYLHYSNYSSFEVEGAYALVQLDEYMAFQYASAPITDLGGGLYRLELGTLEAGRSGIATINFLLTCEAPLGLTHCIDATIEPFTCNEGNFAELRVTGECDETSGEVSFTVTNVGNASMMVPQHAMIVEDVVMYMQQDPILLDEGDERSFNFPANGATWRFEIPQDDTYPWGGIASAFVENCGGFSPGVATQFSLTLESPNMARNCLENGGSWDPNDKQALPKGYGTAHYVTANTPITYLIRFQNTGTDTAFNVRIEDQLSSLLDPKTIEVGASSHPYRMTLNESGLLTFFFDNILLPDSTTNQEASNGFVTFYIKQRPDLADEQRIENEAAIFFDFNEPVITNAVFHTIGSNFITAVGSPSVIQPGISLVVSPNPLQTFTTLVLKGNDQQQETLCALYDIHGRLLKQLPFNGGQLNLSRTDFDGSGLYFYSVTANGQQLVQGKLLVQ